MVSKKNEKHIQKIVTSIRKAYGRPDMSVGDCVQLIVNIQKDYHKHVREESERQMNATWFQKKLCKWFDLRV